MASVLGTSGCREELQEVGSVHHSIPARWAECPWYWKQTVGQRDECLARVLQLVSVFRARIQILFFRLRQCLAPLPMEVFHILHPPSVAAGQCSWFQDSLTFYWMQHLGNACAYVHIPPARKFLCVMLLRKLPKDDNVSTRMRCWGHQREVLERAAGKSRAGFSMLSPHLPISIQKHF